MEDFLYQDSTDCNAITPEGLAWKLLMDDDIKDYSGMIQMFVDDEKNNLTQDNTFNILNDQFQILITMYMEMVFGILKINHTAKMIEKFGEVDENTLETTFKPDLSEFTVSDMLVMFKERFKKIRILLSITEIVDTDTSHYLDFGFYKDYFCRIILKDTEEGLKYFEQNKNRLDPKVRYTFVINGRFNKKSKNLNDFYAVVTLPNNIKAKISFSPINIIGNCHH